MSSFILSMLFSVSASAGDMKLLTYSGRILRPDSSPVESNSVTFTIKILSPDPGRCLLWEEQQTINMMGSDGVFTIEIGKITNRTSGLSQLSLAFNNSGTYTGLTCSSGSTYAPTTNDDRQMLVSFNDGGGTQNLSEMKIKSVPHAMYADKAGEAYKVSGVEVSANTPTNGQALIYNSSSQKWEPKNIVNGTSVPSALSPPAVGQDGQSLRWNNTTSQWEWFTPGVAGAGIATLNGQSGGAQSFNVTSTGTDFTINSSSNIHNFNLPSASATARGVLTSADWTTFNNKQSAGSYITTLTGDISASGPGSAAATIANDAVNSLKILDGSIGVGDLNFAGAMAVNSGILVRNGTQFFNKSCAGNESLIWTVANGWICSAVVLTESDPSVSAWAKNASLQASDIPSLDSSKITSGTLGAARLGSGTADNTKYLRGDSTWQTLPSGADNLGNHTASQNIDLSTYKLVGNGGSSGISIDSTGKIGIGTTSPASSSILEVSSTTQGLLPPRMTTAQRDAIGSPVAGLLIYNTTLQQLQVFDGTVWASGSGSSTQEVIQGSTVTLANAVTTDVLSLTVSSGGKYLILASGGATTTQPWTYFSISCSLYNNGSTLDTKGFYYGGSSGGSPPSVPFMMYQSTTVSTGDVLKISCYPSSDAGSRYATGWKITLINLGISNQIGADNLGNHTASQNVNIAGYKIVGGGSTGISVDSSGNVGVGAAAPASKLEVAGVIHSTTGGIKFPDGTTQTTAASGGASGITLSPQSAEPFTCDATKNGNIQLTNMYTTCVCRNGIGWVSTTDGTSTCAWSSFNIISNGVGRKWSNNSFAKSCYDYKNPSGGYIYSGLTGDGVYTIDPDGAGGDSEIDIYCDMTTDSGGWTLVMNAPGNSYTWTTMITNTNRTNASARYDSLTDYHLLKFTKWQSMNFSDLRMWCENGSGNVGDAKIAISSTEKTSLAAISDIAAYMGSGVDIGSPTFIGSNTIFTDTTNYRYHQNTSGENTIQPSSHGTWGGTWAPYTGYPSYAECNTGSNSNDSSGKKFRLWVR